MGSIPARGTIYHVIRETTLKDIKLAIKTRAELERVLSTGGSAVTVERDLIKDILDSVKLASEIDALISDLEDRVADLEAAAA